MEPVRPQYVEEDAPLLSGREWVIIALSVLMVLNGWYILGIITVNILILAILEKKGVLDRWNATRVLGFILMIRTKRGQVTLEKYPDRDGYGGGLGNSLSGFVRSFC